MFHHLFCLKRALLSEKSEAIAIILADLHAVFMCVDQLSFARVVSDCGRVTIAVKSRAEIAHLGCPPLFLGGQIRDVNLRLPGKSLSCRVGPRRLATY